MDYFGPLCEFSNGSKPVLVIIDAFTRYIWFFPSKSTSSKEVIKHLTSLFRILVVSDRETAFTSHDFSEFMSSRNIKHRLIAVAAPWANGLVERVNRFLKSSLKKLVNDQRDWELCLEIVQYVFNNTRHSVLKISPSRLLLGYDQRNNTDSDLVEFLNKIAGVEKDFSLEREKDRELALNVAKKN
ncbi:Pro-Pol polyprotein [Trachymyrmex zeteki]|uniref:Pro-Pol polyprotein n=1 Tax=Mycetomoellerius zeteki TaxID=64791 RepID=A0A151X1A5_9HYME|nr:Pro-Pol polyprotein [Trachymyrmex zeteki]